MVSRAPGICSGFRFSAKSRSDAIRVAESSMAIKSSNEPDFSNLPVLFFSRSLGLDTSREDFGELGLWLSRLSISDCSREFSKRRKRTADKVAASARNPRMGRCFI